MQQVDRFKLFSENEARVGVIIGTGPSLTREQIDQVSHLRKFGVNNAYEFGLDVHLACNIEWWDYYGADFPGHKWTWDKATAEKYGINYIAGRWADGLSTDPNYIHYHHGSGPQIVNLALHYGCKTMLLIGWDMRYSAKRHYFGEYPAPLQHWPRTGPNGELAGLIREMETIRPADYGIEIINCTPGSALKCYPSRYLSEYLKDSGLSRD